MSTLKNFSLNNLPPEKQKQLLGGAVIVLAVLAGYFLFWPEAEPAAKPTVSENTGKVRVRWDAPLPVEKPKSTDSKAAPEIDPNQLASIVTGDLTTAVGSANVERNLFIYTPPPIPKPTPAPPPPPITINSVNPNSVYARTQAFDIVVKGNKFTPETKIYLNNTPTFGQTTFVSETELRANIQPQYFSTPGQLRVEVKKPSEETKLYSTVASLNVQAPPEPQFKLVGQMVENKGKQGKAILVVLMESDTSTKPPVIAQKNEQVFSSWKIVNIGPGFIEVEDMTAAKGVKHYVKMKGADETANAASFNETSFGSPPPDYIQAQFPSQNGEAANGQKVLDLSGPPPEKPTENREERIKRLQELNRQRIKAIYENERKDLENQRK